MPGSSYWLLIPVAVVAALGWFLARRFASDRIQRFNDRRRSSSKLVGAGEFIDGAHHIPVALALTESMFYYENEGMEGSLDLKSVTEVEYDAELSTGAHHRGQILRLRCFSRQFEFLVQNEDVARWREVLPAHRTAA
jgi:hypothetical protein